MIDQIRQAGLGDWIGSLAVVIFQTLANLAAPQITLNDYIGVVASFACILLLLNIRTLIKNSSLTGAIAALLVSSTALAAEVAQVDDPYFVWRFGGSLMGAVAYPAIKKEAKLSAWCAMIFVGLVCGMAGSRFIVDHYGWTARDYHYAAGLMAGLGAWSLLLVVYKVLPPILEEGAVAFFKRVFGGAKP